MKKFLVVSILLAAMFATVPVYATEIEPRIDAEAVNIDMDGEIRDEARNAIEPIYDDIDEGVDEFVPIYDDFEEEVEEEADEHAWLLIGGLVLIAGLLAVVVFTRMRSR